VVVPQYFQLELDIYGLAGFSFLVWSDVEQRHTWRQGQTLDAGHRGERDHQGSRRRAGRPEPAEFLPKVCCLGEAVSGQKGSVAHCDNPWFPGNRRRPHGEVEVVTRGQLARNHDIAKGISQ
jgi:hypothetical protein